ncbi:DUF397 domain-containing protein [Streptomyces sp. NBC_01643]|uniref:DUF397 domain-containing protein n=1 Tax=Streptomyces sp. NBC_01643 TaxID=2975906 RepID=UPI00386B9BC5|nr:DUF397 domain-containing protein [Streptomyces sp. NBC_01643]
MSSSSELAWHKSSYSGTEGDNCVEVAVATQAVHVRDSKDVTRPHFSVGRDGWAHFVTSIAHV